jgi:hypothetical protein
MSALLSTPKNIMGIMMNTIERDLPNWTRYIPMSSSCIDWDDLELTSMDKRTGTAGNGRRETSRSREEAR